MRLASRLSRGLARLEPERRDRHRTFVLSRQTDEGGFAGREGGADLYYTGFAVRTLTVLGGLLPAEADAIGAYLQRHARRQLSVIDLTSWLYSALVVQASGGPDVLADTAADWPARLAALFEQFRTADGGYAKTDEGAAGSTYHSFLVALC